MGLPPPVFTAGKLAYIVQPPSLEPISTLEPDVVVPVFPAT